MRASTNIGFKTSCKSRELLSGDGGDESGLGGEASSPSVGVSGSGREGRSPRLAIVSRLGVPALGRAFNPCRLIPFCDDPYGSAFGVGYIARACAPKLDGPDTLLLPRLSASGAVVGVIHRCASVCNVGPPSRFPSPPGPFVPASGVGHARTASVSIVPGCMTPVVVECRAEERESAVVVVGQSPPGEHEDPLAEMGRSDIGCSNTSPDRIEPSRGQVGADEGKSSPGKVV